MKKAKKNNKKYSLYLITFRRFNTCRADRYLENICFKFFFIEALTIHNIKFIAYCEHVRKIVKHTILLL